MHCQINGKDDNYNCSIYMKTGRIQYDSIILN